MCFEEPVRKQSLDIAHLRFSVIALIGLLYTASARAAVKLSITPLSVFGTLTQGIHQCLKKVCFTERYHYQQKEEGWQMTLGEIAQIEKRNTKLINLSFRSRQKAQVNMVLTSSHNHIQITTKLQDSHHSELPDFQLNESPTLGN